MRIIVTFLRRPPLTVAILVLVGVLLSGGSARADEGSPSDAAARAANVSKLTDEGFELYRSRDYRHANEKFLQAYAVEQDPNLLFNMARCYEAMGDRDSAVEKYESFLAKPDADPQGKRRATAAIRLLRQSRAKNADRNAEPAGPGPTTGGGATSVAARDNDPDRGARAGGRENGSFLSPPVIVLGSGVLVAVAGGVAYAMGASDHGKVTNSAGYGTPGQVNTMTEAQARQLVQSGDTKKLIGGIALGVGGALLVTSAVLFGIGPSHGRPTKETGVVAFGLAPTGGGGGQLLLEGRF
jgi:hypothetical protein